MNAIATTADKSQDVTTQQSSEVQTVPVSDFTYNRMPMVNNERGNAKKQQTVQSETSIISNESKATATSSNQLIAPQSTTPTPAQQSWASLFANSASNATTRPITEAQKKPVAKVPPYNPSHETKANIMPIAMASTQNVAAGVISYSSAASSTASSTANGNNKRQQPPTKARIAPSSKPSSSSQSDLSIDESSYRLGGESSIISI